MAGRPPKTHKPGDPDPILPPPRAPRRPADHNLPAPDPDSGKSADNGFTRTSVSRAAADTRSRNKKMSRRFRPSNFPVEDDDKPPRIFVPGIQYNSNNPPPNVSAVNNGRLPHQASMQQRPLPAFQPPGWGAPIVPVRSPNAPFMPPGAPVVPVQPTFSSLVPPTAAQTSSALATDSRQRQRVHFNEQNEVIVISDSDDDQPVPIAQRPRMSEPLLDRVEMDERRRADWLAGRARYDRDEGRNQNIRFLLDSITDGSAYNEGEKSDGVSDGDAMDVDETTPASTAANTPVAPSTVVSPARTKRAVVDFITHPPNWRLPPPQFGDPTPHPVALVARLLPLQDILRLRQVCAPFCARAIDADPIVQQRLFNQDSLRPRPAVEKIGPTTLSFFGMSPAQLNPLLFSGRPVKKPIFTNVKWYHNEAENVNRFEVTWETSADIKALQEKYPSLCRALVAQPPPTKLGVCVRGKNLFAVGEVENGAGVRFGEVMQFCIDAVKKAQSKGATWKEVITWEVRFPKAQQVRMGEREDLLWGCLADWEIEKL